MQLLQDINDKSFGVAAIDNGKLIGYLVGIPVANFKGSQRGIYCPEWAHAVCCENRALVYRYMYEKVSDIWVENECINQAITIMAYDEEIVNSWFWNGFGLHVVDAVRNLNLLPGAISSDFEIRKCRNEDIEQVVQLLIRYRRYMASSPICLPLFFVENSQEIRKWLDEPNNTIWLGINKGEVISIMKVSYKKSNDVQILSDDATVSIGETYTSEEYRGYGITKAVLQKVIDESLMMGYKRCAVVFESQNKSGSTFWLKYFKPVCYSVVRKIDDRLLGQMQAEI